MSTWGTWGLMGVNVLLFLVFQFGFEPWRRRRLVHGFEEKVKEALDKEKENQAHANPHGSGEAETVGKTRMEEGQLDGVVAAAVQELELEPDNDKGQASSVDALAAIVQKDADEDDSGDQPKTAETAVSVRWKRPETWKYGLLELFSDRIVSLRRQDITIIALEGAATGAAFVGLIAMFLLRPA